MGLGKPPRLKQEQRVAAGSRTDAVASRGGLCGRDDGGGRADHRLRSAVGLHRHPRLLVGAVPDGVARAWAYLRRVVRAAVRRRLRTVPDGAAYRLAPIFFDTIFVVVAIGAFIPLFFGRETVGQPETVTEGVPALA